MPLLDSPQTPNPLHTQPLPALHPTAIIDPSAVIDPTATVGAYCVIGPQVTIGAGCVIAPHVVIESHTILGEGTQVSSFAALGGLPQDKGFGGETSWVHIGKRCVIREGVTVHRATGEQKTTVVGDDCMLMAYSHVAHNTVLGNNVILANNVLLAGHVQVDDGAFISGMTVVHQNVRIGRLAIISGASGTRQDIPPFAMCDGRPATLGGINKIGLRRNGFDATERDAILRAYHLIWFSDVSMAEALTTLETTMAEHATVQELVQFVRTSKRGIRRPVSRQMNPREGDDDLVMA